MTKRFSEFTLSMSYLLSTDVAEIITPELHATSAAVIDLLERISKEFKTQNYTDVFLINNYYLIVSSLQSISDKCPVFELFQNKLADCTVHFVDLEVSL